MERARTATADDVDHLAALAAEQVDGRGGEIWSLREARALPADASLTAAVADPAQLVVVGTIDDTIVGYAVACTEVLRDSRRLGVITDIFTVAGARAVGVGEAMVAQVIEWCTAAGCVGIDATVLPGNRATKNFFETFGFTARAIVVHRRLAP